MYKKIHRHTVKQAIRRMRFHRTNAEINNIVPFFDAWVGKIWNIQHLIVYTYLQYITDNGIPICKISRMINLLILSKIKVRAEMFAFSVQEISSYDDQFWDYSRRILFLVIIPQENSYPENAIISLSVQSPPEDLNQYSQLTSLVTTLILRCRLQKL